MCWNAKIQKKKRNSKYKKKNWNFFSDIGSRSSVDSMPCVEDPVSIYSDPNLNIHLQIVVILVFTKFLNCRKDTQLDGKMT